MAKKEIYLDHAATTYVRQEVLDAMLPCMTDIYGNPSSLHSFGQRARKALEAARASVAASLHARPEEIFFTSGGTESDNWALRGVAAAQGSKGRHIITSKIEHPAVLNTAKDLEKAGFRVTYLDVDADGVVNVDQLKEALTPDTILVSIMAANNEIGTIQPIEELGRIVKAGSKAAFHVDAVQAVGAIEVNLEKWKDVDLLSLSGHKFYGPKGVGVLFIRKGTRIGPMITGGSQERKKRAGTENVPGSVGFAKALELAVAEMPEESRRLAELRDYLIDRVLTEIKGSRLNGHRTKRLPGNANFSFDYIEGEGLLMYMSMRGVAASTGSACSSASLEPSHVLLAIGLKHETAHGSFRATLGKTTTKEDIDYTVEALKDVVNMLREMSPLYDEMKGAERQCTVKK
ncbi:MAG: cysteine desulfurase NifS [Christensenellaceae bacterium]|nr:cysteine desulfurase NifS [Christensenellaceae bacterium]